MFTLTLILIAHWCEDTNNYYTCFLVVKYFGEFCSEGYQSGNQQEDPDLGQHHRHDAPEKKEPGRDSVHHLRHAEGCGKTQFWELKKMKIKKINKKIAVVPRFIILYWEFRWCLVSEWHIHELETECYSLLSYYG